LSRILEFTQFLFTNSRTKGTTKVEKEGSPKTIFFMRNVNLFSAASTASPSWPEKLTRTKKTFSVLAGIAFLLLLFVAPTNQLQAQCGWAGQGTTFFLSAPQNIPCGTASANQSVGSGTYNYFYAYSGVSYAVITCGS
jgi:hypothetical protein